MPLEQTSRAEVPDNVEAPESSSLSSVALSMNWNEKHAASLHYTLLIVVFGYFHLTWKLARSSHAISGILTKTPRCCYFPRKGLITETLEIIGIFVAREVFLVLTDKKRNAAAEEEHDTFYLGKFERVNRRKTKKGLTLLSSPRLLL
ncbi:unnamed protein product [Caenorhabditis auriculariae]|uniref:Uncharacterized protein n=1 Tax=Caenorhabditis auriculariae TaxID=2777116 RepID=A0A8S1H5M1_9PELO|nr:unnamed protein product [Caenorhabditis auriculariae]